ncbi:hypothetical protein V1280_004486 [Bradyrhizobium sp. AZCC 2230]
MSQQALERMARPSCYEPDVFAKMQAHQRTESSRCVLRSRFHLVAHVVHAVFRQMGRLERLQGERGAALARKRIKYHGDCAG